MKRFLFILTLGAIVLTGKAQDINLSDLKLNFEVPDMPAFKSLGTDPSAILKPSNMKAIAATVSEFYSDRKFVIPQAMAVEISPALLINAKKPIGNLQTFQRRALLNSLRLSLGSSSDEPATTTRNLAAGMRISLVNKADPATDPNYLQKVSGLLADFRKNVRLVSLVKFAGLNNIDTKKTDWEDDIFSNDSLKAAFNAYLADEQEESQSTFLAAYNKLKEEYKKTNWNATKLDWAASVLSTSPDSLVRNIRFNSFETWLTGAFKCSGWGQILIGLNGRSHKDLADTTAATENKSYFDIAIPVRLLVGTNRIKGFAEAQYSHENQFKTSSFFFNMGADVNIVDGIWANVKAGIDYNSTAKASTFVSTFHLKFTLPEKFKLF